MHLNHNTVNRTRDNEIHYDLHQSETRPNKRKT